jgi:hypothetical protein
MFRSSRWILYSFLAGLCCLLLLSHAWTEEETLAADAPSEEESPAAEVSWLTDYAQAVTAAKDQEKMLLVFFSSDQDKSCTSFESDTLADPLVRAKLQKYVCVRLPLDATVEIDEKQVKLLDRAMFKEMQGKPGIAIVDYLDKDEKYYAEAVSTFPLKSKLSYTPKQMLTILDLPSGTLTQRTLIYAVRIHPEHPASAAGKPSPYLLEEAEGHSEYQAKICVQGHHNWGSRFKRIISRFTGGITASEVCAESWPGDSLVEAAIECVRCWRLSSGHWSAVRARCTYFGYDMKRGKNGVWYATGIFGRKA